MSQSESLCLNIAINRLVAGEAEHFAIWVWKAPYTGGYVLQDRIWPENLTQIWLAWQDLFSPFGLPESPLPPIPIASNGSLQTSAYSVRLMQHLGIELWKWLFDGSIQNSLERSQGIAIGKTKPDEKQPLRLRLEIRDPNLILLPWEIMQPQAGEQAVSLSHNKLLLFSRTTKDVAPLSYRELDRDLKILLVLGEPDTTESPRGGSLKLDREAEILRRILENSGPNNGNVTGTLVPCEVKTLVMPTPAELISSLEEGSFNIFFYAGHGKPAPDGGLLFLRPNVTINGTELAQVLTRCGVTLAVFNSCWGAQSATYNNQPMERSSLAEVLIHHGVPAVLAMRDAIADEEAISFIEAFAKALAERMAIDAAVAVARQDLMTLYGSNQPAWTLPVLYMHPQFDGQLLEPLSEGITGITGGSGPGDPEPWRRRPLAYLRPLGSNSKVHSISGGELRVGRKKDKEKNDLVICHQSVSREHATIYSRKDLAEGKLTYILRDYSTYGTWVLGASDWQHVHEQEVPLESGMQLKFGSLDGQAWEFIIES